LAQTTSSTLKTQAPHPGVASAEILAATTPARAATRADAFFLGLSSTLNSVSAGFAALAIDGFLPDS
jgi:hypothetical protein